MWEMIKNDKLLRTLAIIILGVLGFGFAYNIMFGAGGSGMEHGMGGNSLTNSLSAILQVAVYLFLIALFIAAIVAVFKFTRKYVMEENAVKMLDSIRKDPVLRITAIVVSILLALGLIYLLVNILFGSGSYRIHSANMMGNGTSYSMMVGTSAGFGFTAILRLLVNLLLLVSIVGVLIGVVMFIKQNYSRQIAEKLNFSKATEKVLIQCSSCGFKISQEYKFCPSCGNGIGNDCPSCGTRLKSEWKCCPTCGAEVGCSTEASKPDEAELDLYTEAAAEKVEIKKEAVKGTKPKKAQNNKDQEGSTEING